MHISESVRALPLRIEDFRPKKPWNFACQAVLRTTMSTASGCQEYKIRKGTMASFQAEALFCVYDSKVVKQNSRSEARHIGTSSQSGG